MRWYFSERHRGHDPVHEVEGGQLGPAQEVAERAEVIAQALRSDARFEEHQPRAFGRAPIEAVHDPAMVDWLEQAWAEAGSEHRLRERFPDTIRHPGLVIPGASSPVPTGHRDAGLGYYCFDTMTPIVAGTAAAALSAVDVALSALEWTLASGETTYGCCRPPGHHAAAAMIGGYCYLNNAAIAAQQMTTQLAAPVAIIDVDYHHGNGTQAIFYDRDDVFYLSLHGDPDRAFPYFTGYPDEVGTGAGRGWTANVGLEAGTDDHTYSEALARALDAVERAGVAGLVVSLGVDTYREDPISDLALSTEAYGPMGARLAALGLPTVVLQEGGYDRAHLGVNVREFLVGIGALPGD